MSGLPSGTLTFLFTDIQGSTRLWESQPEAMSKSMVRHDLLFDAAVEGHAGYVVRPRGEGDGRFAVFQGAADAVAAATQFQRALYEETWPVDPPIAVRIALHTGEATLREGDYYGTAVNRCARIRALAHGGQTLLSGLTTYLARNHLPEGVCLLDLGEHELKDLQEPEHIFQLVIEGLPSEFPPLASQTRHPTNLPAETTTFVGREDEIATVSRRLLDPAVRLVTLVGPGGVGKTRLALRIGQAMLPEFEDGVFFVPLAALTDHTLTLPTIAQVLNLHTPSDESPLDTLREHLRDKHLLLLLDNFDHLIGAAPQVAELLAASSQLKILITSREAPRLRGNQEIAIAPLGVPDPARLPPLEHLQEYASIQLFVERAREIEPDFELTSDNAASVAAICYRLDGLPLAIELAAARIRLFPPDALLARLDRRLQLLTSGPRDLPARQQTLRSAIDWSYDLLEPQEQALFRRLTVFQGSFTLDAAEAVCGGTGPDGDMDVLLGIDSLVSKSLLRRRQAAASGADPRFGMLQTLREYGQEHLEQHNEAGETRRRHAHFYLSLAERAEPELMGREQGKWVRILAQDHDNLRAALAWSFETHDDEVGLRLAGALWPFWEMRGYFIEGQNWLDQALALDGEPQWRAKVLSGAGTFAWSRGHYAQAISLHTEALELHRQTGDRSGTAFALNNLGVQALSQGNYERARALFEESLEIYREQRDGYGIADVVNNLGVVAQYQGYLRSAEELYRETLQIGRRLGDDHRVADALYNLGEIAYYQLEYERAWDLYHESLILRRETGSGWGAALCLAALAGIAAALGAYRRAARLAGAAQSLLEETGYSLDTTEQGRFDKTMAAVRAELGEATSEALWTEGHLMTPEEAIEYGIEPLEAPSYHP